MLTAFAVLALIAAPFAGIRFGAVAGHLFATVAGLNDGICDVD